MDKTKDMPALPLTTTDLELIQQMFTDGKNKEVAEFLDARKIPYVFVNNILTIADQNGHVWYVVKSSFLYKHDLIYPLTNDEALRELDLPAKYYEKYKIKVIPWGNP